MPTTVLVARIHSSIALKSTLSVDATVNAFFTNRLLVPAFFLLSDAEWIIRFSVSIEERIPNLFKMVINSVESPHNSMTSLNTAWKGKLHSLLVINSIRDTRCALRRCLIRPANVLSSKEALRPLSSFYTHSNKSYSIKLVNIKSKLHGQIIRCTFLMVNQLMHLMI